MNDTTREVGATLGIAVSGSILAAQYQDVLAPRISNISADAREPALHSLAEALAMSERLGAQDGGLSELARQAFPEATNSALLVMATVIAVAAVFVWVWALGAGP